MTEYGSTEISKVIRALQEANPDIIIGEVRKEKHYNTPYIACIFEKGKVMELNEPRGYKFEISKGILFLKSNVNPRVVFEVVKAHLPRRPFQAE